MKRKSRALLACLVAAVACGTAGAESAPQAAAGGTAAGPCSAPAFREFDFWAGTWDVADASGQVAGRNQVSIEQQGCVLVERWKSVAGNTGLSVNFYDPLTATWTQQWIGLGLLLRMTGALREGRMVLEGPLQYVRTGKVTRLRGTWSRLPDGGVRQHFEESEDGGRTWQEWFDGYYRRAATP
jgi:hypothetical protein